MHLAPLLMVHCDLASPSDTTAAEHALLINALVKQCVIQRPAYFIIKYRGLAAPRVYKQLASLYRSTSDFHLFKPAASYPWNNEVFVAGKMLPGDQTRTLPDGFFKALDNMLWRQLEMALVAREVLKTNSKRHNR